MGGENSPFSHLDSENCVAKKAFPLRLLNRISSDISKGWPARKRDCIPNIQSRFSGPQQRFLFCRS